MEKTGAAVHLGGIGLEIVRGCNFRCRMCPSAAAHPGPMDYMTRDTAKKVVDRINETESIAAIWSFGMGEALAHPDCYEMFSILNNIRRTAATPIILHTNASCLSGESAYAVLELPYITQLYISFDGYGTKESFEYLRGPHFHEVINRVRDFMLLAKQKRPGLFVGTCSIYPEAEFIPESVHRGGAYVSAEDAEEKLKSIFEPMGVHVGMRRLHKYNGFYIPELYKGKEVPSQRVFGGCRYLEEHSLEIAWDGKVRPCHDAANEDFTIGDLRKEPFSNILSGRPFLDLRHQLRLDRRCSYAECANCDKYSFGEDVKAAAEYWRRRITDGEITDPEELSYLGSLAGIGEVDK